MEDPNVSQLLDSVGFTIKGVYRAFTWYGVKSIIMVINNANCAIDDSNNFNDKTYDILPYFFFLS